MRQHKKVTSSEKLIDLFLPLVQACCTPATIYFQGNHDLFGQMHVSTPCFERDAQEKESLPHEKDMTP